MIAGGYIIRLLSRPNIATTFWYWLMTHDWRDMVSGKHMIAYCVFFLAWRYKYVSNHCKTCHIFQMAGKKHQKTPEAPLQVNKSLHLKNHFPLWSLIALALGLERARENSLFWLLYVPVLIFWHRPIWGVKGFLFFGLPTIIRSDCDSNFQSKQIKTFWKELGIDHITSSSACPGEVPRDIEKQAKSVLH